MIKDFNDMLDVCVLRRSSKLSCIDCKYLDDCGDFHEEIYNRLTTDYISYNEMIGDVLAVFDDMDHMNRGEAQILAKTLSDQILHDLIDHIDIDLYPEGVHNA